MRDSLSANKNAARNGCFFIGAAGRVDDPAGLTGDTQYVSHAAFSA